LLVSIVDRMEFGDRQTTADGYLATTGKISRSGILQYAGHELGKPEISVINVYRDEADVFDEDAVRSFAYKPITDDHPPVSVTSKNWRDYSRGQLGGKAMRDGETLDFPMVIMDQALIDKIAAGKVELSAGYSADITFGDGIAPDGTPYQAKMSSIRGNHVALVARGRSGASVRIGDAWPTEIADNFTPPKKEVPKVPHILHDGLKVDLSDAEAVQALVTKLTDAEVKLNAVVADAKSENVKLATDHKVALDDKDDAIKSKDVEIATLKKALDDAAITPEKLRDAAAAYSAIVEKAKAVGVSVADNASTETIMRAVVDSKMGEVSKDWNDKDIAVSFATLTANVKLGDATDPYRVAMGDRRVVDFGDAKSKALEARNKRNAELYGSN